MAKRLSEVYDEMVEQEAQIKLANVEKAYTGDAERVELLERSIDLVKEAAAKGDIPPVNASELISMAVQITEQAMMEKEAEAWQEVGSTVAQLLEEHFNITSEDIEKIASEEEAEEFGRFCARLYASHVTGEDYLQLDQQE